MSNNTAILDDAKLKDDRCMSWLFTSVALKVLHSLKKFTSVALKELHSLFDYQSMAKRNFDSCHNPLT